MRTVSEITAEIQKLKDIKPKVRRKTLFGEDNHEAIDIQIHVLEKVMTESKIYDTYDSVGDDDIDHDEGRGERQLDNAMHAFRWMHGDEEKLSEDWPTE